MNLACIVFFELRVLDDKEKKKAKRQWTQIIKQIPKGIELIGRYWHSFGTEWNGFLLFKAKNAETFHKFWHNFRDKIRWYVPRTKTIIGFLE